MRRLLKRIAPPQAPDAIWLQMTFDLVNRAAALRTQAITSGRTSARRPISIPDAHLVALAEERSIHVPVTILTSDPADIRLLVDLTGAKNIAVDVV